MSELEMKVGPCGCAVCEDYKAMGKIACVDCELNPSNEQYELEW